MHNFSTVTKIRNPFLFFYHKYYFFKLSKKYYTDTIIINSFQKHIYNL